MAISVHTPKAASYTPSLLKINRAVSKESSRLVLPTEINVSHAIINGVVVAELPVYQTKMYGKLYLAFTFAFTYCLVY